MTDPRHWQQEQGQPKYSPNGFNQNGQMLMQYYQPQPMMGHYYQQPMAPNYYQHHNQMMPYQSGPMYSQGPQVVPYDFEARNETKVNVKGGLLTRTAEVSYDSQKRIAASNVTDRTAFHKAMDKLF